MRRIRDGYCLTFLRPVGADPILFSACLVELSPSLLMKRSLLFVVLLVSVSLGSCQCTDPPDVGPVEGDGKNAQTAQVQIPGPLDRT